jgi:anti-sigma factor RsiW
MTCREVSEFLADYLSEELAQPSRRSFEEHLAECPDCRAYLASYKATVELGKAAFAEDENAAVPEQLVRAILRARSAKK